MTRLQDLYEIGGQSPWLDNLRRDWLEGGQLAELLHLGVRGITSNPTILAHAISGQDTYDDQFRALMKDHTVEGAYWEMAITDIDQALGMLRPLYDESDGEDGFVSLEVSPVQAHETADTLKAARDLHKRIAQPNLFVKVPATREGVPAIETLIGEGHSINVTLIFGLDRYDEVMEAYLRGLETLVAAGREDELSKVASVASFFVSRVDTEVDRRLETLAGGEKGDAAILGLRGTAAVAQAQTAYQHFHRTFAGDRWEALRAKGARVQRPLWASTSTKNPGYSDLLYVDSLIGPATVNTMPEPTLRAFEGHGTLKRTADADPDEAASALARLADGRHRHARRRADARGRRRPYLRQVVRRAPAVVARQSRYLLSRQHNRRGARMRIGMIGLGKMGANMTERLLGGGHEVVAYDLSAEALQQAAGKGAETATTLAELVGKLTAPRAVWVMLPAGKVTDSTVEELAGMLSAGDVVVDGGNSNYKEFIALSEKIEKSGVGLVDAGTSGGVWGLTEGYCLMVGGTKESVAVVEPAFLTLAPEGGYAHVGPVGAGHFVKMVHNGIEYGLMQAYAEGFEVMAAGGSSTSTCTRSRPSGATGRWCAAGCSIWRRGRCGPGPASTTSRAWWPIRARGAGRRRRPSTVACRRR